MSGRRRRRSRPLRIALALTASFVVLVTAGAGWLYLRLGGSIHTFSSDGVSGDRPDADASKGENVLVIGSDARTGGNSALGGGDKGDIGRSDTTLLLHIYAGHRHAVAVSIPRDSLVTIPSCKLPDGTWTKERPDTMFNAAYSVGSTAQGNPACTQNTVEKLTGLRVDHTVVVDFKGFAALTDVVGGVRVCLPQNVYARDLDPNRTTRGALLFPKGEQTVSGQRALDYVRIRHGIGDGSDIGRIKRQQAFMAGLMKKIRADGLTPTRLLPLANAATESLTVDPGLGSADKLISFAMSLKDVDPQHLKFVTVPWRYEGSRVALVQPDADRLWASLKDDRTVHGKSASPTPSPAPSPGDGIAVSVHNGTTVPGLAARAAAELEADGFTVTGTATAAGQGRTTTVVEYGPGLRARAATVAARFPGATLAPAAGTGIDVILGTDYPTAKTPEDAEGTTSTTSSTSTEDPTENARSADADPCDDLSYG
ncbi:LCP family protein [Streptomyces longispororuber]|uniref:LCP family protein n=1 Tax=Streptomyces longispororuber TaxID=68230 RepID=UPI00210B3EAF|nr:LCP family protein [Streptomyces longispororuber]MCQ4207654.1 LCP family protein [Streptomyces longispororuber]